jgi:hypothetical protein
MRKIVAEEAVRGVDDDTTTIFDAFRRLQGVGIRARLNWVGEPAPG